MKHGGCYLSKTNTKTRFASYGWRTQEIIVKKKTLGWTTLSREIGYCRGEFDLYEELRVNDREHFFRYFRMNPERFDHLSTRSHQRQNI